MDIKNKTRILLKKHCWRITQLFVETATSKMEFIQFCLTVGVVSALCGTSHAACSPCPFQWMQNQNYCYRYFPEDLSYEEAKTFCESYSVSGRVAELATITSLGELNFIMEYIDAALSKPLITHIWLSKQYTRNDSGESENHLYLFK